MTLNHLTSTSSSGRFEWYTPPEIFQALGIRYHLDPCAPREGASWVPAAYRFSSQGLERKWFGRVWMNPPYGHDVHRWMKKFVDHGDGVALVFARTDTRAWQHHAFRADAVCFISGRLKFIPGPGVRLGKNAGAPSALVACGERCKKAVLECGLGKAISL